VPLAARLLALAAALALVLVVCAAAARAQPIYVTNNSELPETELLAALPAIQAAADQDFAPAWNVSVTLVYAAPPPGAWTIELVDSPDCWFCAAFHDVLAGAPRAQVGLGDAWTINFTHELWEMLADPWINRGMLVSTRPGLRRWWALEVADPVEADALAYTRDGIQISDFVTEAWFRRGSRGPWDFAGHTKRPLQVLPAGYQLVWNGHAWEWRSPGYNSIRT
jgi:hypothetical protein